MWMAVYSKAFESYLLTQKKFFFVLVSMSMKKNKYVIIHTILFVTYYFYYNKHNFFSLSLSLTFYECFLKVSCCVLFSFSLH